MAVTYLQQLPLLLGQNLGYLSGNDLASWCDPQLLIARQNIIPRILQTAANQAVAEVQSKLINIYDLTTELLKTDVLGAAASCTVLDGVINTIILSNPGTCYTSIPTCFVTPQVGDPGTGAILTPVVSPSILTSIEILNPGRRYTIVPTVSITGGGGDGSASAVATLGPWGNITAITITDPGNGFTGQPTITITGNGICAAAVAVVTFGKLTGITITAAGTGYAVAPTLSFAGGQIEDMRNPKLVKLMSIFAVRNVLGNAANISDKTKEDIEEAEYQIEQIQSGMDNLPLYSAAREIRSDLSVVSDRFNMRG